MFFKKETDSLDILSEYDDRLMAIESSMEIPVP